MDLLIHRLNEYAIIPSKNDGDSDYDVYATPEIDSGGKFKHIVLMPNKIHTFGTGICSVMPVDYRIKFETKSSLALQNITVLGGVIDSSYRGEWKVILKNLSDKVIVFTMYPDSVEVIMKNMGFDNTQFIVRDLRKAICQCKLDIVLTANLTEIEKDEFDLYTTVRGAGGFGSTGK